jgi:excinuclease ABC subunit A
MTTAALLRHQKAVRRRHHQSGAPLQGDRSEWAREELVALFHRVPCEACHGYRLKPEALCVKIGGKHIGEVAELSVRRRRRAGSRSCPKQLTPSRTRSRARPEGNPRAAEIPGRCRPRLSDAGARLRHAVGRRSQRIRLASQIGSGLTGVLYVLDEPSIGLHQRDNARLLETLKRLRDLGNTVIVVEHDEDAIRTADHVSTSARRRHPWRPHHRRRHARRHHANPNSLTGKYLTGELSDPRPGAKAAATIAAPSRSSTRAATISKTSRRKSRSACSPASPASRAAASRRC